MRHGAAIPAGVGRWASDHRGTPAVVRVKDVAGCLLAVGKVSAEPAEGDTVPGVAIEKVLVDADTVSR
ncbi:MAG: hypothetical protein A3K11_01405 [Nitrospirae bacterium RIFCSPLOWO2_12_FULL_63_8]|nr:MAG: hypothetical protein A3K11_01405 [Nitrospirae bacterium RIFCSPLOWO2_12_FULL_63_8]